MIDPADQDTFRSFSETIGGPGSAVNQKEFRVITKSGEVRTAVLFANPILDQGQPAMMINLMDISVQQRLEEKIHLDNERRRGIIITVAHELRTPLQPILGYLNLLIQDPQGFGILDDTKKMLERCLVSVERERQIINQMVDLSVLESGKLHLSYSNFSLASLVNSVIDAGGYLAKSDVSLDLPPELMVSADMDRLYSVLDSLLANAVNYSKPPRIIRIVYHPGAGGTFHTISVTDNGIGIANTMFTSIFEPFQLADAVKLSRKYDRLGLSLSIAKKIMQMHGGDITVESVVNTGSTFTIHLPCARPEHA
jgi:signal transduction histidine kinase